MDADDRPVLHALVCYWSDVFGIVGDDQVWPKVMPLEEAVDYARVGFAVLVDPGDEADLALWERIVRSVEQQRRRKWYEAPN